MEECIFCKIARREAKAEKIYETENVVCFLDINPRAPGHSLIIPKKHAETLADLENELIADLFKATKRVVVMLKKAINPDAFIIGINDGKAAGQEIPHLHVNIIPRFRGDGGKPVHYVVNNPPSEEVSEMAEKIRNVSISPSGIE
jgi:histidine triad (HIT) family protein